MRLATQMAVALPITSAVLRNNVRMIVIGLSIAVGMFLSL